MKQVYEDHRNYCYIIMVTYRLEKYDCAYLQPLTVIQVKFGLTASFFVVIYPC